jgi:hypothetical protein
LTHVSDSVKVGDGTDLLAVNNDGSINAVVSATDLDIRDLAFATDSVTAHQGGTWNVNLTDDSVADDAADTGNPFKVGGVAYASGLTAVSAAGDRVNLATDLYRRVRTFSAASVALNNPAVVTVGTSAVALPSSALAGRHKLIVQNTSSNDIYVGASDVTTTKGIRVAKGATLELNCGEVALYGIAAGAGNDVRVLELA